MEADTANAVPGLRTPLKFEERLSQCHIKKELSPFDIKVIVAKGKMFRTHRNLLVMASPEFELLVKREEERRLVNTECSIKLSVETEVFRIILKFLYMNTLDHESIMITDMEIALMVLEASVQYQIDLLEPLITEKVLSFMKPENALKVLEVARCLADASPKYRELEEKALKMIKLNGEFIIGSEEFSSLGLHDVSRILSGDDLVVEKEIRVFNAALRWAKARPSEKPWNGNSDGSTKSLKYYFNQLKHCVRFLLMKPDELALVTAEEVLDPVKSLELFRFLCLPQSQRPCAPSGLEFESRPRNCYLQRQMASTSPTINSTSMMNMDASSTFDSSATPTIGNMPPPAATSTPLATPPKKRRRISNDNRTVVSFAPTLDPSECGRTVTIRRGDGDGEGDDDDDCDDLFLATVRKKDLGFASFEDYSRRFIRRERKSEVGEIICENITLDHLYHPIVYKSCKTLSLDLKFKFFESNKQSKAENLKEFLSYFDPMRYIFLDTKANRTLRFEDIWSLNLNIQLKFSGITLLKVQHKEIKDSSEKGKDSNILQEQLEPLDTLILNYIRDSRRILSNETFRPGKLAMSNCEFSAKGFKDRGRGEVLKTLILYRCWGDFSFNDIMLAFPQMEEFVCWKKVTQMWPRTNPMTTQICIDFQSFTDKAKENLRKLVLFKCQLRFPSRIHVASNISELYFDHCYSLLSPGRANCLPEAFAATFPKLRKLVLIEQNLKPVESYGNLANPQLINSALEIETLELLHVIGMKWSQVIEPNQNQSQSQNQGTSVNGEDKLEQFLDSIGLLGRPENFMIQRNTRGRSSIWESSYLKDLSMESTEVDGGEWSQRDEQEFEWYSLNHFYDTYEVFEDYFLQEKDKFPVPMLWV